LSTVGAFPPEHGIESVLAEACRKNRREPFRAGART
jgi:hypothetical protein